MMEQNLAVHIFHKDPKRFRVSVHFFVPLEVGSDGQFHLERGPTQEKRGKGETKKLAAVGFEPTPSK